MKRVRLHAYENDGRLYGEIRYAQCKVKVIAYRRVSGGKPGRKCFFWLICGKPKNKSIHEKKRGPSRQKWIFVFPVQTSEERSGIRRRFCVFLHAPFDFLKPN